MPLLPINPTQWLGLCAFAVAAAACVRAARRCGRPWTGLAWWQAACAAEVVIDLRQRVHGGVDAWLAAHGAYATRLPLQVGLLALALSGMAGGVWWAAAGARRDGPAQSLSQSLSLFLALTLARAASTAAVMLFVVESISLHAIDALMFTPIGPVLAVGWMWTAAAVVIIAAALSASSVQRPSSPPSGRAPRR